MIFDSHCHLFDEAFDSDIDEIVQKINSDANFGGAIIVGTEESDWQKGLDIANKSPKLYSTVGVHPEYADKFEKRQLDVMEKFLKEDKVVALGEIGIDYHWQTDNKEQQRKVFLEQFDFAKQLGVPVSIHQRDVGNDILNLLKQNKSKEQIVIMHCFCESVEMAKEMQKLGCFMSIAGPITFKNANKLLEVGKFISDEFLLVETDSPYLTPQAYRGKRNEPHYTRYVVEKLAELRGQDQAELEEIMLSNIKRAFKKVNI